MSRNLKMPWSLEDTVENMERIRDMMIKKVRQVNMDGKGEEDVIEIKFDFGRVKEALEKQIAKSPNDIKSIEFTGSLREQFKNGLCPCCNNAIDTDDDFKYCSECGQKLKW